MKYNTLPNTDLEVSAICLGTMSYGKQLHEEEAHQQLDMALDMGVNFWDTAEMYPVPVDAEHFGKTEAIMGRWFAKTGKRKDVVLATKVVGPGRYEGIRDGDTRLNRKNILQAIDESLGRLQTEVIDLYQLHWPDRNFNYAFGKRGFPISEDEMMTPLQETLEALKEVQQSGKVRYFGLSNETPWGTMKYLELAKQHGLPRMISIQNCYNLLNRHYEVGMSEVSLREDIPLLAYSPLAFGVLGGRYFEGAMPEKGRFNVHPEMATRYRQDHVMQVAQQYAELAAEYDLSLAQLSLAFVNHQPFVASNIIGASTLEQLKEDIESIDIQLSDELLSRLEELHERHPNLCA